MTELKSLMEQLRKSYQTKSKELDAIEQIGFPDHKTDGWRYTDLVDLYAEDWSVCDEAIPAIDRDAYYALSHVASCVAIHIVNGVLSAPDMIPEGIEISTTGEHNGSVIPQKKDAFSALNEIGFAQSIIIRIRGDFREERPIHIALIGQTSLSTASAIFPNVNLVLDEGIKATVIVTYESPNEIKLLSDNSLSVNLAKDAKLNLIEFQNQGDSVWHLSRSAVALKRNSEISYLGLYLGSRFGRHELNVDLLEENAHASLKGLYLVNGHRFIDCQTQVRHNSSSCKSEQTFKGVLTDSAKANFEGLIRIGEETVRSDASQANRNMLLSKDASVHASPYLEIYADDVKCSHGCTIGQIDEDQVFFMRCRGIPEDETRALLTYAFANEIVQNDEELYGVKPFVEECIEKMNERRNSEVSK